MMPAHYALTDAAILAVAISAGIALWRNSRPLPALAMASFGIPAAIGVIRLGGGLQTELAAVHVGSAQLLGLAGAILLAVTCFHRMIRWDFRIIVGATLIIASAIFFLAKALLAPFFVLALVLALGAALRDAVQRGASWLLPVGLTILLANVALIRGASWLTDAARWHVYHLLIALALAIVAIGIRRGDRS